MSFNGVEMANAPKPAECAASTNATTLTESDILHMMGKAMGSETLAKVLLDSGLVTVVRGEGWALGNVLLDKVHVPVCPSDTTASGQQSARSRG